MKPRHWILLALAAAVWGSLAATGGYAWYLRSDTCRLRATADLSAYLELPAEIGGIVPRSSRSREFRDIQVFLPDRRGQAFFCQSALLTTTPLPGDPEAYELTLAGGSCELSDRTWLRSDYRHVLESGLRPSFDEGGPRRVQFAGMDIGFTRERFHLDLTDASGRMTFVSRDRGDASVYCQTLNGHRTPQDVHLTATFSPQDGGIRVDALELAVPRLPLSILRLDALIGGTVSMGDFAGRLHYAETAQGRRLAASGACYDIQLHEWTRWLGSTPWRGRCPELELLECRFAERQLERLRFRGTLADVKLGDILALWGVQSAGGDVMLRVGEADISPAGIRTFVASGQCLRLPLDSLTAALGWGQMTGVLRVVIEDLTIRDNRLARLDARIEIEKAEQPNFIEGRLIREVVNRVLKFSLPPVLPERIEYTRFGLRLEVRDEELRVFGSHGPRDKTILTIRLFEQEYPLVPEPEHAIDLTPWMDTLRATMLERLREQTRVWSRPRGEP